MLPRKFLFKETEMLTLQKFIRSSCYYCVAYHRNKTRKNNYSLFSTVRPNQSAGKNVHTCLTWEMHKLVNIYISKPANQRYFFP